MRGKWIRAVEAEGLTRHLPCYDVIVPPMSLNLPLGADPILCLAYAKARSRAGLEALFTIDAYLAGVALGAREPMMARIKLAWWREQGLSVTAPANDLSDVIALIADKAAVLAQLDTVISGWDSILGEDASLADYAQGRGEGLFAAALALEGRELDQQGAVLARGWAMADLARATGDAAVMEQGRDALAPLPRAVFAGLPRALGVLAILARCDAERGLEGAWRPGSPKRMARALRFALTNR